jgi:hypothetical protein
MTQKILEEAVTHGNKKVVIKLSPLHSKSVACQLQYVARTSFRFAKDVT